MQSMHNDHRDKAFGVLEWALLAIVFLICLTGAYLLPVSQCPDERARLTLTNWILEHGALPTGNEPELIIPKWGFSYAARPFLSSIIGAAFANLANLIGASPRIVLLSMRMCSVLSITGLCAFCLLLGKRLFEKRASARLFAILICFLPEVLFLGMYQNNDSLSLFSVSMLIYALVCGRERHWSILWSALVGVAMSVCLLSYYCIYGWILLAVGFCIVTCCHDPQIARKGSFILKRALLIFVIVLCLAGWQFIRTAYHHNMDFLGLSVELSAKNDAASQQLAFNSLYDQGKSLADFFRYDKFGWIRYSAKSFIGVFGYMDIHAPWAFYCIYFAIFIAGAIAYLARAMRTDLEKDRGPLLLLLFGASALCCIISILQSYLRDYQPQGRYIITCSFCLAYMCTRALDLTEIRRHSLLRKIQMQYSLSAVWICLFIYAAGSTMVRMLY